MAFRLFGSCQRGWRIELCFSLVNLVYVVLRSFSLAPPPPLCLPSEARAVNNGGRRAGGRRGRQGRSRGREGRAAEQRGAVQHPPQRPAHQHQDGPRAVRRGADEAPEAGARGEGGGRQLQVYVFVCAAPCRFCSVSRARALVFFSSHRTVVGRDGPPPPSLCRAS